MQVVAIQVDPVWEDKATSQQRVRALLRGTTVEPGALLVLPEMFETGFSMDISKTAQSAARESELFLKELAREYQAAVIGGVVGPIVDGRASNEAVAFAPDGTELVRYQKMQPFSLAGEERMYGRGLTHRLFCWNDFQIAPFICYDLRFPERFRPAARDGAELIVLMACWPEMRSEHWVRLLQARAIENLAYVVGVNRCGEEPSFRFDGRSAAFDPMGRLLFEADAQAQVLTTQIDADAVRQWRQKFPALRDMSL